MADGLTEEIITQLGSLDPQRLGVIARTSAMHYKRTEKSSSQIAREVGADYLLEGSIRRSGERIRVTAQLIQSSDQTHLWAIKPTMARLTLARKIAAITLTLWKKGARATPLGWLYDSETG